MQKIIYDGSQDLSYPNDLKIFDDDTHILKNNKHNPCFNPINFDGSMYLIYYAASGNRVIFNKHINAVQWTTPIVLGKETYYATYKDMLFMVTRSRPNCPYYFVYWYLDDKVDHIIHYRILCPDELTLILVRELNRMCIDYSPEFVNYGVCLSNKNNRTGVAPQKIDRSSFPDILLVVL